MTWNKGDPKPENWPRWLKEADIEWCDVEIKGSKVLWRNGTWDNGLWRGGVWKDGIWVNGEWRRGCWTDGHWKDGVWCMGTWGNGTWDNGTWDNGTWENGIWVNGEWMKGDWLGGLWRDGLWRDGLWRDGLWENGTWERGKWERGRWRDGTMDISATPMTHPPKSDRYEVNEDHTITCDGYLGEGGVTKTPREWLKEWDKSSPTYLWILSQVAIYDARRAVERDTEASLYDHLG